MRPPIKDGLDAVCVSLRTGIGTAGGKRKSCSASYARALRGAGIHQPERGPMGFKAQALCRGSRVRARTPTDFDAYAACACKVA